MLITPIILALLAQTAAPAPAATSAVTAPATATAAPAPAATVTAATTAPATPPAGPAAPPNIIALPEHGWMPLFNGENLDGWYTFRQRDGKNNDVEHVFKVESGAIHVLDIADTTVAQPNGYLATNEEFRNYRARVEYEWGVKKFTVPRHPDGLPRDAGLLYHINGPDAVWPICVEFQINEHDTGDVWLLPNNPPNPSANTTVVDPNAVRGVFTYMEGGVPALDKGQRLIHSAQYDLMDGWNTVQLYATENNAVQVVNGHVNNAVSNLRLPRTDAPMSQGKIGLQEENNEVFYRNVEIMPLFACRFGGPAYKILVYVNDGIIPAIAGIPKGVDVAKANEERAYAFNAIKKLGGQNNFTAEVTRSVDAFTDNNLKQYKAVVFLGTTGLALPAAQQQAFARYIRAGGGFVGVTPAPAQSAEGWDWYGQLVGAQVDHTTDGLNGVAIKLVDLNHPATSSLPLAWPHLESVPYFNANPDTKIHVLATVSEAADADGAPTANAAAWCHDFDGGRAFYTALGSAKEDWSDPLFLIHLLGGIEYAAQTDGTAPVGATVLFDGTDTSHWVGKDNATFSWNFHDGVIDPPPATYPNNVRVMTGDIHTKETYTDFQLHVEFKVPGTKSPNTRDAITNEQARGNSGVYLQGRYEAQILDSFDHPLADLNDEGAIYSVKDADINASLPAEVWQSYDITFHAARWQDGKKTTNARATVYLNGVLVQNDAEIPHATTSSMLPEGPEPGPIALQDHLNPVQFRYVWIKTL